MAWVLCDADWNSWPDGLTDADYWAGCAEDGVAGVELGVYRVAEQLPAERLDRLSRLAGQTGVPVAAVLLSLPVGRWPDGALTGTAAVLGDLLGEVRAAAAAARTLGLDQLRVWPGADPLGADWAPFTAAAALVVAAAGEAGVTVAFEPKPGTVLAGTPEALLLGSAVPGAGCLLDTGHAWAAGEDPAAAVRELSAAGLLAGLHLGDAAPGSADDDLPLGAAHDPGPLVRALAACGFAGVATHDLYGFVASGAATGRVARARSRAALAAATP